MPKNTAGYSGTPLVRKLGIKPGFRLRVISPPQDNGELVPGLPEDLAWPEDEAIGLDLIHFFTKERSELEQALPPMMAAIAPQGMIWVSWPKKASRVKTDVTEDTVRELALPLGLVDVKVCAVDATWSGLKLVIRKERRSK